MTLYETIFTRRQVRSFIGAILEKQTLTALFSIVQGAQQISGQQARFEIASSEQLSGCHGAPYGLLAFCESTPAAYANIGFVLQKADLYLQSLGLGSGWFMSAKPKKTTETFCIALVFGKTKEPMRENADAFKRKKLLDICATDNAISQAVRLAPSSMNSQPWKLRLEPDKIILEEKGNGLTRVILKNKLNKIDLGIAARHAVTALEQEEKTVTQITAKEARKKLEIEILYH